LVKEVVVESVQGFTFSPGDISNAIDKKVKKQIAHLIGLKELNMMDLVFAMHVCELAGKDKGTYLFRDLSKKADS
jgi:hypothetical protein